MDILEMPLRREILNVYGSYDVAVVGGGIAGVAAALAAARNGAKVLLLEKMTMLGGLGTAGHIVIYLPLDDGYGNQVMGGIAEELLQLSVKYSYGDDFANWKEDGKRYRTRYNGPVFALAMEELLQEAGVDILYDTLFAGSVIEDGWCRGLIVENKSGRGIFLCKAVVDATGDAEVFQRAGEPCASRENSLAVWCFCTEGGEGHVQKSGSAREHGLTLLAMGKIDMTAAKHIVVEPYYGDTAEGVNRFVIDGHKQLMNLVKQDKDLVLASLPSMAQIRMVRRIRGLYTLTEEDLDRHFADNIGATGDWRRPAPVYEIPYRTLFTQGLKNVLAAGRCISSEGDAWDVTRVIPPAAVTGQGAGTAAVIMARDGISAPEVPLEELRTMLVKDHVMLDVNAGKV